MGRFDPGQTIIRSDTTVVRLPVINVSIPPGKPVIIQPASIPQVIDTAKLIQEYFAQAIYRDSIENDTIKIGVHEVVSQNRITFRDISYKLKLPITSVVTHVSQVKRNQVYLGGVAHYSDRLTASLALVAINKKDQMLMATYDPINRSVGGGVLLKIRVRK